MDSLVKALSTLGVCLALLFVVAVVGLLKKSFRRNAAWLALLSFVGFVAAGLATVPLSDRIAREAGYSDFASQQKAQREVVERERAEASARAAAKDAADSARKLAELRAKIPEVKKLATSDQFSLYSELADLDPKSDEYKLKRDQLKPAADLLAAKKNAEDSMIERAQENPEHFLELEKFSWSKGGFGVIMMATFTIKNTAPVDIKDFAIHCTDSAPSGTVVDSNDRTIYDVVKANSTRIFYDVNMGFIHSQASSSGCEVSRAVSAR